jgi:Protein of unknown function (DUF3761)
MTAAHRALLAAAATATALLLAGCQPADSTHRGNPTQTSTPASVVDTTIPDDSTPAVETSSPDAPPPPPPTTAAAAPEAPAPEAPAPDVPADDHPAGATAKCVDGTYSYAAHHQGACSHHHGVAEWYR